MMYVDFRLSLFVFNRLNVKLADTFLGQDGVVEFESVVVVD